MEILEKNLENQEALESILEKLVDYFEFEGNLDIIDINLLS